MYVGERAGMHNIKLLHSSQIRNYFKPRYLCEIVCVLYSLLVRLSECVRCSLICVLPHGQRVYDQSVLLCLPHKSNSMRLMNWDIINFYVRMSVWESFSLIVVRFCFLVNRKTQRESEKEFGSRERALRSIYPKTIKYIGSVVLLWLA